MEGAGNDFILVDDRQETFPCTDKTWLISIAARRRGVGCEGIILIQPSRAADISMRFFNPDGTEVEMCGNGIRCLARLACEIKAAPPDMKIETKAGILSAKVEGRLVKLEMPPPAAWRLKRTLKLPGQELTYSFVNVGVPHVVVETNDLDVCDVAQMGRAIRYHEEFSPGGTNANFITVTGDHALRIRTYERGVEGETLACGTGITASALVAARLGKITPPVQVTTAGGDVLTVDFRLSGDEVSELTLLGPARHVFEGVLEYPSHE